MDYVYAYLSYFGYKDGQRDDGRVLGRNGPVGQGPQPVPRRVPAIRRRGGNAATKALELYREPAEYFYGRCLHTDPMCATPPGYVTEATQRAGITSQVGRAAATSARARQRATEMQEIVDLGYVIVGSPDEVVAQLTEVAETLNVGHLMLLLQFGNMSKDLAKYNTKLFAEEVMPRL